MAPQPGDVLLTRGSGWGSFVIRLGAAFRDTPNMVNHVAIVHHTDEHGTVWCLEGRPGGVGWRDAKDYLRNRYTMSNPGQAKSKGQRKTICDGAHAMIGTGYDWAAIVKDAGGAFGLGKLWNLKWGKGAEVPGHVVCSSLAAYLYAKAGLAAPAGDREVTPGQWCDMIIKNGWG